MPDFSFHLATPLDQRLLYDPDYVAAGCPSVTDVDPDTSAVDDTVGTWATNYAIAVVGLGLALYFAVGHRSRRRLPWMVLYFGGNALAFGIAGVAHQVIDSKSEDDDHDVLSRMAWQIGTFLPIVGSMLALQCHVIRSQRVRVLLALLGVTVLAIGIGIEYYTMIGVYILLVLFLMMLYWGTGGFCFFFLCCGSANGGSGGSGNDSEITTSNDAATLPLKEPQQQQQQQQQQQPRLQQTQQQRRESRPDWGASFGCLLYIAGLVVQIGLAGVCGDEGYKQDCFANCPLPGDPLTFNHNAWFHILVLIALTVQGLFGRYGDDGDGDDGENQDGMDSGNQQDTENVVLVVVEADKPTTDTHDHKQEAMGQATAQSDLEIESSDSLRSPEGYHGPHQPPKRRRRKQISNHHHQRQQQQQQQ